jgi:hypothetical protein
MFFFALRALVDPLLLLFLGDFCEMVKVYLCLFSLRSFDAFLVFEYLLLVLLLWGDVWKAATSAAQLS